MVMARVLGSTFRRFHQPQVMGEVIAGIFLEKTNLGMSRVVSLRGSTETIYSDEGTFSGDIRDNRKVSSYFDLT
jgi:Kef-type K+ transport system membrane component KefB